MNTSMQSLAVSEHHRRHFSQAVMNEAEKLLMSVRTLAELLYESDYLSAADAMKVIYALEVLHRATLRAGGAHD